MHFIVTTWATKISLALKREGFCVRKTGAVATLEDHQIDSGLGSAVSEFLGENYPVPMHRIGLHNTFAESGEYELLLKKY